MSEIGLLLGTFINRPAGDYHAKNAYHIDR